MIVGYEPSRLRQLRAETIRALDALATIRSSDPAADDAMARLRNLARVLDADVRAPVDAIVAADPLVRSAFRADLSGSLAPTRPRTGGTAPHPGGEQFTHGPLIGPPTRFSGLAPIEFLQHLSIDMHEMLRSGAPGVGAPFGTVADIDEIIAEVQRRVATDPVFAALLVGRASADPLIAQLVAHGDFDDDLAIDVAVSVLSNKIAGTHIAEYRTQAMTALLERILDSPATALDFLGRAGVLEPLSTWNHDEFSSEQLPEDLVADVIVTGLIVAPSLDRARHDDAFTVLAEIVELADDPQFTRGLPPLIARPVAAVVAAHVSAFRRSASDSVAFNLFTPDDEAVSLGGQAAVTEFFGSLMHDPLSRSILVSIVQDLAVDYASDAPSDFSADDIDAFAVMLNNAVAGENDELRDRANQLVSIVGIGTTITKFTVGQALSSTGVGAFAKFLSSMALGRVGDAITDRIPVGALAAPDFEVLTALMVELELIRRQLRTGVGLLAGPDPLLLTAAITKLSAVDALFTAGSTSIEEFETEMGELDSAMSRVRPLPEPPSDP